MALSQPARDRAPSAPCHGTCSHDQRRPRHINHRVGRRAGRDRDSARLATMTAYEQPATNHPFAKGFSEDTVHREEVLEVHLCAALVEKQSYRARTPEDYDRPSALDRAIVLEFIHTTQTEEWEKLAAHYGASAEDEFLTQLEQGLKQRGTLDVLRNGLKLVPNLKFFLCAFQPA